ncbi:MAG TPA: CHAT domain-containing protein, partial [Thermoanaerobaculia bacterium]|nr:CHAT domain-containing protein [Thermoanaerobaculia bacterium]
LFDLTVQLGPGMIPWISAASRLGHVHGIPRKDPKVPPVDDLLDGVFDFVDAVRFAEREPEPELGRHLRELVFGEPTVLELFQATRGAAADRGKEILLRILASPHLAVLPWELLPDPAHRYVHSDRRFLTLAPDAHVVRLARGRTYPVRSQPLEPPLNLLVVLSSPIGRDPGDDSLAFDIYEEKRSLVAELQPLEDAGLLKVDIEDHPTLENLRRRIGSERRGYHLFHYLGHAQPDGLILEDAEGRRDDSGGARFTEILRLCPDLRLAVFAGCETARAPGDPISVDAAGAVGWKDLLSLADRSVQESSPVVVGMQAVLPFRTERLFTRFFYQGLASGYSVAGAVRLARGATRGDRHVGSDMLDWSVPVLFVSGSDPGPLLSRSAAGVPPKKPARHSMRLGLRQQETRFFARDVALRQAIEVLSGNTPERVLIVTGPAQVGKTMLLDRALEELGGPLLQLYVRFEDLVPSLKDYLKVAAKDTGQGPREWTLKDIGAEEPLERLCELVADLLTRADGRPRGRAPARSASDWWRVLVEDLVQFRCVIAVDDLDSLADLEKAIVRRLLPFWMGPRLVQAGAESNLTVLLEDLVESLREPPAGDAAQEQEKVRCNLFMAELPQLASKLRLARPGQLDLAAREAIAGCVDILLDKLRRPEADVAAAIARMQAAAGDEEEALLEELKCLEEARCLFDRALEDLANLRSLCRLALSGLELPNCTLGLRPELRFEMRLGHLTWPETWRWIRRNLPGLLRYGEDYLSRLWPRLGPDLSRWEELERRVLAGSSDLDVDRIVNQMVPRRPPDRSADRPRGERPLRLAMAGPYLAGPAEFASVVTRLAGLYRVGGRVVSAEEGEAGALATLLPLDSPFRDGDVALESVVLEWVEQAASLQPDVILLDYGRPVSWTAGTDSLEHRPELVAEHRLLASLRHRVLLIAAGGHGHSDKEARVWIPGSYRGVLAVGPLGSDNEMQPYARWLPDLRKPDLFMPDELLGTPLGYVLRKPEGEETLMGSSFAALHAVAAAIMVWSTLPHLSPRGLARLLQEAAEPMVGYGDPAPRRLTIERALAVARKRLVTRTLGGGPCSLQALAAITGLDFGVVSSTIAALQADGKVRALPGGRLERFELAYV